MWVKVDSQKPLVAALVGLVMLSWIALWVWGASPYGRFLTHESLGGNQAAQEIAGLGMVALFVAGWTLMTMAMMLPTSLPLIMLFYRFAAGRRDRLQLLLLLIAGYLGVWTLFGTGVHLGDTVLHNIVSQSSWLENNHWLISSATFVLAGLYQFTSLKYKCLDKCRSPMSFIVEHWRGRRQGAQAFMLGLHHGLFCVGCCWSLMLLMFAIGANSLVWMLVLGGVMAVEKNVPWGRRLSAPLGVFLIGLGLMLGWGSALNLFGAMSHG
jgi:predicted metal-binding membrane protein